MDGLFQSDGRVILTGQKQGNSKNENHQSQKEAESWKSWNLHVYSLLLMRPEGTEGPLRYCGFKPKEYFAGMIMWGPFKDFVNYGLIEIICICLIKQNDLSIRTYGNNLMRRV
jgi:hypothetical protein